MDKPYELNKTLQSNHTTITEIATYILAVIAIPVILLLHLLPTLFAGLTVHVLTTKLAMRFPVQFGGWSKKFALAALVIIVVSGLSLGIFGIWTFLHGSRGMAAMLEAGAEIVENARKTLPPDIAQYIPPTMEDFRYQITGLLRSHSKNISGAGIAGIKTVIHVLFGMIIGGMTAILHFEGTGNKTPFIRALEERTTHLAEAFDKIVFAQVKISSLNTLFTAVYLVIVLPILGIHIPMVSVLVPFTFVSGLLPVVGNLISNSAIVLLSLGVSIYVALGSLVFLIVIHKLEYFFNAKIVGGEVQAGAWELLSAMLLMEAAFGVAGLVAAPIIYAWLKAELRVKEII